MIESPELDRSTGGAVPPEEKIPEEWLPWRDVIDHIPLGVFIVSGPERNVKINSALGTLLGLNESHLVTEEELWHSLCSLSADPERAKQATRQARSDIQGAGTAGVVFEARQGQRLDLRLAKLPDWSSQEKDYVGWINDCSQQAVKHKAEVETLSDICGNARMDAAGAAGNLQALSENLRSWSPDVVADFLEQAVERIERVQESLDLALRYASLIRQLPIYRRMIEPGELIDELTQKFDQVFIRTADNLPGADALPAVEIDLALTKLAVETLVDELLRHNPPGLQIEAILTGQEQFLLLRFISPRTLPLPGLAAEPDSGPPAGLPVKLLLARELLFSQGVKISIQDRPLQEGGGADMEIYFPIREEFRPSAPSRRDSWEDEQQLTGRILLAESQPDDQVRLRTELTDKGFRVDLAADGSTALDMVQTLNPDLVILSRNLPGMDGLLVTQGIRRWSAIPIIMISNRNNLEDQLYAYQLGVDDYLRKPILIEELLAKVRVFITRQRSLYQDSLPEIYQSGSVRIDNSLRQVWIRGSLVELTPIEYNLLLYLSRQRRQIVTYEQLMESAWEGPEKGTRQGLFVHIRRLREKIELDPKKPQIIKNKWGVGYVFNP